MEPNNMEIMRELAKVENGNHFVDGTCRNFSYRAKNDSDGEQHSYRVITQCNEGMVKNDDECDLDSNGEMEGKKESSNTQAKQLPIDLEVEVTYLGQTPPYQNSETTPTMASLNTLLPLLLLLLLLLQLCTSTSILLRAATTTSDLVSSTCNQTPDPNMCEAMLRADPRTSEVSEPEELILIMIDAVKSRFTDSLRYALDLTRKTRDPEVIRALKDCIRVYRVVLDANVVVATSAVRQGDPKFGEQAMLDSANEAEACRSAFPEDKVPAELPGRTRVLHRVSNVAASLIKTLE
ncbi:hypothetical protein Cgig2_022293 [Carnegiea gigantea]|uniref:Pectinesterase inhibitor domain-containing protein n=1 Tax=Carnegiea gigantea TaxID=171969 RepID=A0A9Q1KGQ1_9CARY|nr:hypothetical protein Cgig2_022293 [Carnegiea gigantea]